MRKLIRSMLAWSICFSIIIPNIVFAQEDTQDIVLEDSSTDLGSEGTDQETEIGKEAESGGELGEDAVLSTASVDGEEKAEDTEIPQDNVQKNEQEMVNQNSHEDTLQDTKEETSNPLINSVQMNTNTEPKLRSVMPLSDTITYNETIHDSYGLPASRYQVNWTWAWCVESKKETPFRGMSVTITPSTNENLRKVLWYGCKGPGAILSDNIDGWMQTAQAASLAYSGTTVNSRFRAWYNAVITYASPPSGFKVYIASPDNSTYQDLAYFVYTPTGTLSLQKKSAVPSLTDDNPAFSLEGAVYYVYSDANCTKHVGTFKTDANGKGKAITLEAGTYYVREITPSKGYGIQHNSSGYPVTKSIYVSSGGSATLEWLEYPQSDPVGLLLRKLDAETGEAVPQGDASLAGAQYEVKFYLGTEWEGDPAEEGEEAVRSWILKTKESGYLDLSEICKVSGDDFWLDSTGTPTLPVGTLTIREIQAPTGYLLNDELYIRTITAEGTAERVDTYNIFATGEPVMRGDIEFTKYGDDPATPEQIEKEIPLAGVEFSIILKSTGEVVKTVTTDENGFATTKDEAYPNGALPYGTYLIKETGPLPGYLPMEPYEVSITEDKQVISGLEFDNKYAQIIGTTATDIATGTHESYEQTETHHKDVVAYENLIPGQEYELITTLMLKSTGKPVMNDGEPVTAKTVFTPEETNGTVEVEVVFDSTGLRGEEIVFFEKLYQEGEEIVVHEDLEDKEQTIKFADIHTYLTDQASGTKIVKPRKDQTLIDTVSYTGLVVGKEYRLTGQIMIRDTKSPLKSGEDAVVGQTYFVPKETDGKAVVQFKVDVSHLKGSYLVAFEELYDTNGTPEIEDDILIVDHKDFNDKGQTIRVQEDGWIFTSIPRNFREGWTSLMRGLHGLETGDSSNIWVFVFAIVASVSLITFILWKKKKGGEPDEK